MVDRPDILHFDKMNAAELNCTFSGGVKNSWNNLSRKI
jgi:hypothetical protein